MAAREPQGEGDTVAANGVGCYSFSLHHHERSRVQVSRQAAGRSRGSLAIQPRSAASVSAACVVPVRPATG